MTNQNLHLLKEDSFFIDKESFLIEQYKILRERLNEHEKVRFQMIVLNVTGFAAIFGFSGLLTEPIIPLALLSLLLICSRLSSESRLHNAMLTAYIIERYGKPFKGDIFESGYAFWSGRFKNTPTKYRATLRNLLGFIFEPYIILSGISLLGFVIFSYELLIKWWISDKKYLTIGYISIILFGHIPVFYFIYRARSRSLIHFRIYWKGYLSKQISRNVKL